MGSADVLQRRARDYLMTRSIAHVIECVTLRNAQRQLPRADARPDGRLKCGDPFLQAVDREILFEALKVLFLRLVAEDACVGARLRRVHRKASYVGSHVDNRPEPSDGTVPPSHEHFGEGSRKRARRVN